MSASYRFECADPGSLESIEVALTAIWSGIEDLDVRLVGPGGQGAAELDADRRELDLSAVR